MPGEFEGGGGDTAASFARTGRRRILQFGNIRIRVWLASAIPAVIQCRSAMIQPSDARMATASAMPITRK
jgi:hypothetical protein